MFFVEQLICKKSEIRQTFFVAVALTLVWTVTWYSYQPGMDGVFVLDDTPNLSTLDDFNLGPSWRGAFQFALSGESGPTGRPLSMAAFLPDASDWPETAGRFRRTNVLLHLINGLLLYLALRRLFLLGLVESAWPALALASLWLVSPANTATTLYVVQRMTLLSSLFMFLGFYLYLMGRPMYAASKTRPMGSLLIASALLTGLGFGVLSKENAITFLLVLLAAEATVFSGEEFRDKRRLLITFLATPVCFVILYFGVHFSGILSGYEIRDFTLRERLLTQPLVLATYFFNTLIPISSRISVFQDDFTVITDLLAAPSAGFALLGLLAAAIAAMIFRKRYPLAAFAVLAFLSVHALEASVVPLELYFEHRNYLGSVFVLGLAAILVLRLLERYNRRLLLPMFCAYFSLTSFVTYTISRTWGDPFMAAIVWPAQRPGSVRAQQFAVDYWGQQGQLQQAENVARAGFNRKPRHVVLLLQAAQMRCVQGKDVSNDIEEAKLITSNPVVDNSTFSTIDRLYEHSATKRCSGVSARDIVKLLDNLSSHARVGMTGNLRGQGWFIKAKALHEIGDFPAAMAALEESRRYSGSAAILLWRSLWLLESGNVADAKIEFDRYEAKRTQSTMDGRGFSSEVEARADYLMLAGVFAKIAEFEKQ